MQTNTDKAFRCWQYHELWLCARVCQRSHNFSHYSLEWLEWCWMHDGERLFSVAWHWMLKTCIQLSITRVGSLQLCSMHATLAVQRKEPQTNNSVVGLLLYQSWVVVLSPREIAGTVWNSIDVTNLSVQGFQRRNLHDEGVGKSTWIFCTAKKLPWQGL